MLKFNVNLGKTVLRNFANRFFLTYFFRFDWQRRDVPPVSVPLPEWGWPLAASADVFLPRTQQKLLLPERASRGLRKGPSLGGNQVRLFTRLNRIECLLSCFFLNKTYSCHQLEGAVRSTPLILALHSDSWSTFSLKKKKVWKSMQRNQRYQGEISERLFATCLKPGRM